MDAELVELAARYSVTDLFVDDLPGAAVAALSRGVDSPSLVLLASANGRVDPAEVWSLFSRALAELQIPVPPRKSAAELLKVSYARKVLTGEWSPRKGAQSFVYLHQSLGTEIADRSHAGDALDLAAMFVAHYSYFEVAEGDVARRDAIDRNVVSECQRLIAPGQAPLDDKA